MSVHMLSNNELTSISSCINDGPYEVSSMAKPLYVSLDYEQMGEFQYLTTFKLKVQYILY